MFYIIGDNGASAEGHINGSFNEYLFFNGAAALETPEFLASRIDQLGTPQAYNHFSVGLGARDGHALPVDQAGGLALGRHPQRRPSSTGRQGISEPGQVRHQFHHVIDIAPTVLDVAGLPHPERVQRRRAGSRCTA